MYDPQEIIAAYTRNALIEDQAEKMRSLRTEIPREFIKRYFQPGARVLDAGGGVGMNSIYMTQWGAHVTLLDLTPRILELARKNLCTAGLESRVKILLGDICNLQDLQDEEFEMVVCVGDAISYTLDQGTQALKELVRVAKPGAILILGTDSKFGFLRLNLARADLAEARQILETSRTQCGMGPRSRLYTAGELHMLLVSLGCRILETASTPSLADTFDQKTYHDQGLFDELKEIELAICTHSDLLGVGLHLLVVAQKSNLDGD